MLIDSGDSAVHVGVELDSFISPPVLRWFSIVSTASSAGDDEVDLMGMSERRPVRMSE
jgi:hypothetical protein